MEKRENVARVRRERIKAWTSWQCYAMVKNRSKRHAWGVFRVAQILLIAGDTWRRFNGHWRSEIFRCLITITYCKSYLVLKYADASTKSFTKGEVPEHLLNTTLSPTLAHFFRFSLCFGLLYYSMNTPFSIELHAQIEIHWEVGVHKPSQSLSSSSDAKRSN